MPAAETGLEHLVPAGGASQRSICRLQAWMTTGCPTRDCVQLKTLSDPRDCQDPDRGGSAGPDDQSHSDGIRPGRAVALLAQLTLGDVVAKVSSIDLGHKCCGDAPDGIDFLNRLDFRLFWARRGSTATGPAMRLAPSVRARPQPLVGLDILSCRASGSRADILPCAAKKKCVHRA
jgi:hypothetical protein